MSVLYALAMVAAGGVILLVVYGLMLMFLASQLEALPPM